MLDLHSVTLSNFRAYMGSHHFEFPTECGLYFFTGENNAALGSNGSGKSTLLDAIVWALYGRTARGLKANEVITWGAASCQVTLELTVGNERLTVKRTQKPNNLFLGDKPVDQKELEKHIRLNYEAFTYSVISTQFGESFLALSPSAKLTLFSDIHNLDFWLQKSDEAAVMARGYETDLLRTQHLIAGYEAQLATVAEDIVLLQQDSDNFKRDQELRLKENKKAHIRATNASIELDDEIKELPRPNLSPLIARRDKMLDNITGAAREHAEYVGMLKSIVSRIEQHKILGNQCPTCNQKIEKHAAAVHNLYLYKEELAYKLSIEAVKTDLEGYKKLLIKYNGQIDAATAQLNELHDKRDEVATLEAEFKQLVALQKQIETQANPHAPMLQGKKGKLKALKVSIAENKAKQQQLEASHEAVSFWIKGFKRVRLFIIEQAFQTLEIEVNNSLAQLGMTDWQISFDIERENKSGGVTKGFVVFVKGPANDDPVRWENWSGGETQRLQLAGDLGLANLIMQQAGLTNTIEMYDEPSTHLSPEGMMDLANMLHDRAINEGKRIWIVDHTAVTNFGGFTGIITVRRDGDGTAITYNAS